MTNTINTVSHIPTSAADIQVGDIFYSSKTYNSTLVTFYQVVSRTKKTFTLKEMKAERNWDDRFGSTGTSLPTTSLSEREYKGRIAKDGSTELIVRGYCGKDTAYPWDGSAKYISND